MTKEREKKNIGNRTIHQQQHADETHTVVEEWKVGMSPAKQLGEVCLLPIPNPIAFVHKKRKITLEIVSTTTSSCTRANNNSKKKKSSLSSSNDDDDASLREGESILFRVFKQRKSIKDVSEQNEDNHRPADNTEESVSEQDTSSLNLGDDDDTLWKEHYRYPDSDIAISSRNKNKLYLTLGVGQDKEQRDILFKTEQEAQDFEAVWKHLQERAKKRAIRQLEEYRQSMSKVQAEDDDREEAVAADILNSTKNAREVMEEIQDDEDEDRNSETAGKDGRKRDKEKIYIRLLVDIVRGSNLTVKDPIRGTSDPFVVVYMHGKEVHRTSHVSNDLNPVWTIKSASLFLLEMTAKGFFLANDMTLIVKDHDALQSDNVLEYVKVPQKDLLFGTGERQGYRIKTYNSSNTPNGDKPPMLYLRFKKATEDDIKFVEAYKHHGFGFGLYADEAYWPLQKRCSTSVTLMHKNDGGVRKTRVMPEPDPNRPEDETMWMTSEQLQEEALKGSTNWVQAGSGDMGTLFFEVIGCDNLPDMDSVVPGDGHAITCAKIDSFACIVYEDSVVNTDVISNCSSPRWMPWTYRAFKFQMSHPATDVLLGIFDHDNAYNPAQVVSRVSGVSKLHDAAGRVVIELSKLQPDTTYLLKYPLYYGESQEDRKTSKGTVTVRLRIEFPNVRKVLLTALSPPKNNVVALSKKSQWSVAHYTAQGATDDEKFAIGTMTRYVEELEGYLVLWDTIRSALWHIWMWRSHCTVSVNGYTLELPLHSITAYIWAIKLSWNYDLLPSFIFFCIGWIMLASLEQVNRHPSRWHHSPHYTDFLRRLILNTSVKEKINSGEKAKEITQYEERVEKEQKDRKKKRKLEQAEQLKIQREVEARMQEAEKAEKSGFNDSEGFFGLNLRPLKPILYPYQKMMRGYIQQGRMAQSIVLWNESYYAFWLTTFAFLLSGITYFVPWSFLLTWSIRGIVILFLGPWMKIVDIVCFRADPTLSVSEQEEAFAKKLQDRYQDTLKSTDFYQIRSERARKLNDMRQFMFGMHLLRVPMLHTDVVSDVPTSESSAEPAMNEAGNAIQVKHRKFGQFLEGDMIPKREVELEAEKAHSEVFGRRFLSSGQKAAGAAVGTAVAVPTKLAGTAMAVPTKLAGNAVGIFKRVGRKAGKND